MGRAVVSTVVRHVADASGPASVAHADAARALVSGAAAPMLERLAASLGGAQHAPRPRSERRLVVVAAGDHGCGDPGIAMGPDHPTIVAAHAIASGTAALSQVARASNTPIILIDAGTSEAGQLPSTAIALGRGPSADLTRGPAMTVVDAYLALDAGIALSVSLSEPLSEPRSGDDALAVLALGAIGVGAEVASAALLGALTGTAPRGLADALAERAGESGAAMRALAGTVSGVEALAAFGGPETGVLAGLILGAASMNVPVILDGYATGAAALVAAAIAPAVVGYLIAGHRGSFTMPAILAHLGLVPIFDVGLGHGEGTGAAMVLPLVDQVASLARLG